jgi:hypothetical protein
MAICNDIEGSIVTVRSKILVTLLVTVKEAGTPDGRASARSVLVICDHSVAREAISLTPK